MRFDKIFQYLVPKDRKFFPMFEQDAENLVKVADVLRKVVETNDMEVRDTLITKVKELEHVGDDITHNIFDELNKTFITPFDREDIQALTSSIDDVVDYINGACQRMRLYKPKALTPEFSKIAQILYLCAVEIEFALKQLNNLKNPDKIMEACIRINSLENQGDDEHHFALKDLFENEKDAIELIKKKEIIQALEKAIDSAENVSDVLKSIIVKNA